MCLPVLIIVFLFGLVIFFGLLFRIREYEVTETEIIVRSGFGKLRRYRLSDYVDVVRVTRDLELTGEQIQESIEIDKGKKTFRRNRRGSVYRTPELGVFEHEITSTSGQYLVLVKASGKNSLLVSPEDSSSFASTIKAYLKRTSR